MQQLISFLLRLFRKPTAVEIAKRELEEAQRQLLAAQSGAEYAARMANYNQDRIARLRKFIELNEAGNTAGR